jgi:2-polyprenyl-3-methyl-5-hydroxy-6-metoxy-1,4-benzoquinol methylase
MKRIPQHELLDHDEGTLQEITASLKDLRFINRNFGGISTTRWLLRRALAQTLLPRARVLEVAAGDGYAIQCAARHLPVEITALDRRPSHLANGSGLNALAGDALHLPCSDNSFDFVSCALFVHHLASAEVVQFASEALRVARYGLLVNDLVRSRTHLALVYLGFPLFRSRITRHDGPASVRQAYTTSELEDLLRQSPASRIEISTRYLYRMAVIAWK